MTSSTAVSDAAVEQQMALMASSGVESVRFPLTWADSSLRPARTIAEFDRLIGRRGPPPDFGAGQRDPVARWVSSKPGRRVPALSTEGPGALRRADAPARAALRTEGNLLGRTPASLRPGTPMADLERAEAPWNWDRGRWAQGYVRLLKAAYRAIHAADRGAKVVAGSLVGVAELHPVGRDPRPLQGGRQGLLRRDRGASVHQRPASVKQP